MARLRTHYDNLKVSRDAPVEVIKSAYRALANKYHPDRNGGSEKAMAAMQVINASYEVLIDPEKRKAHDAWIDQHTRRPNTSSHQQHFRPRPAPEPQQEQRYSPPQDRNPYTVSQVPGVGCSLIPALLIGLTLLLLASYIFKSLFGPEHTPGGQSPDSASAELTGASSKGSGQQATTEDGVEVRRAIPVDPTAGSSGDDAVAASGAQIPQVSPETVENRRRAINGEITDADVTVLRGTRVEGGASVPYVAVSVFGQPVVEARRETAVLPNRRQVETYTLHFPNSSPGFHIFLKRDNQSFNLVCLDAAEIIGILNRAFELHREARTSQASSFSTRIPTEAILASGSSFDSWLAGTASSITFKWDQSNLAKDPSQYPLIEGNDWFPTGNLQGPTGVFTLYDAIALETALKVLIREGKF
jgi:curved DNA-binding protein CbpA